MRRGMRRGWEGYEVRDERGMRRGMRRGMGEG